MLTMEKSVEHHEVIVLGSGPAGGTAAIYAARAGLDTCVIGGDKPGGQIIDKHFKIYNYPGFPDGVDGQELSSLITEQAVNSGAVYRNDLIHSMNADVRPFVLYGKDGKEYTADSIIIATGAKPKSLGVPGEWELMGNGVSNCATCDGPLFSGQDIAVVGGGYVAVEQALYMAGLGSKVTLLYRGDKLKVSPDLQEQLVENENILVKLNVNVQAINGTDADGVQSVAVNDLITGEVSSIPAKGVFVAAGYKPNTDFLPKNMTDQDGFVMMNSDGSTSMPGIFAAGDVANTGNSQIATSVGEAATAAIAATNYIHQMKLDEHQSLERKPTLRAVAHTIAPGVVNQSTAAQVL